jgi:hypothetical protein
VFYFLSDSLHSQSYICAYTDIHYNNTCIDIGDVHILDLKESSLPHHTNVNEYLQKFGRMCLCAHAYTCACMCTYMFSVCACEWMYVFVHVGTMLSDGILAFDLISMVKGFYRIILCMENPTEHLGNNRN